MTSLDEINVTLVAKEQKELNITPAHQAKTTFETATFGMGCYWAAESLFGGTRGVLRTTVGYVGNGPEDTEVVEIDYDPEVVSYEQLLDLFWHSHDSITRIKRKYMSLIAFHNDEQFRLASASKEKEAVKLEDTAKSIQTEISQKQLFFPAADFHQKYRLQGHKEFCGTLDLNTPQLLQTSYVASKLNGYLAGVGGLQQFKSESDGMGLTPTQFVYCCYHVEKNEGAGLHC